MSGVEPVLRIVRSSGAGPPIPTRTRWKLAGRIAIVCLVLVAVPLIAVRMLLGASLPVLDGRVAAPGSRAPMTLERDALGIPTVEAADRLDLAYGIGFAHAQDRFFQMDLSRRLAAGELAELFGRVALEQDERTRLFRFRDVARAVVSRATPAQRAIGEAYARGVNAGLASLRSRPWEYWVLGAVPAAWQPEDTALVTYAMWWDLQSLDLRREMLRRAINLRLGGPNCGGGWKCALQFFYPHGTSWDSPNPDPNTTSGAGPVLAVRVPTPEELNVRGSPGVTAVSQGAVLERAPAAGSNGWVIAGRLTATGGALVASDMHLTLRVPTVWYRARLRVTGHAGPALDLNGLTLPGAPALVAGSNGHIAWGFTNSYGHWSDLAFVPCTEVGETSVRTATDTIKLSVVRERIHVKGEPDRILPVQSGPAGVLFEARPQAHRCWFARWLATFPAATNLAILGLEEATSVEEALALAPGIGIPHQNFMVGDRDGHIGWSVLGRIPAATDAERFSGAAPWTTAQSHPRLFDPPTGRIWTANARPIDDARFEATIGGDEARFGAGYDLGARAHQVHDDLFALLGHVTPADMLRIQLDDRARFLARWRTLVLTQLDAPALRNQPRRAQFRALVADWNARASPDAVGYRLVRAFHSETERAVWAMLLRALAIDAAEAPPPSQFEGALWELVSRQPMHMLAAEFPSWHEFVLAQVDATLADLESKCETLARCTWGARRPVSIRHPLSRALPFASRMLDMQTVELPGDHDMPRVQDGAIGASERFAVTPGHEAQGYLQIAGGQSGHPLSPYYRAGFRNWAEGKPLPFLPGRAEHRLLLEPE